MVKVMDNDYDHIKEYIAASIDEKTRLLVSDFAVLWNRYESELFDSNYTFNKLKKTNGVFDTKIKDKINENVKKRVKSCYDRFIWYLSETRRYNVNDAHVIADAFNIRIHGNNDVKGYEFDNYDDFEKLYRTPFIEKKYLFLLLIVGRVRNNMFHGIKNVYFLDERADLFKICNEILTLTLDIMGYLDEFMRR